MNGSFVLIDILHHQYSARPSSTAVVEAAELMNGYLTVADAFKDRFQIKVFLVTPHLFQLPVTSYQDKSGTEFADVVERSVLVDDRGCERNASLTTYCIMCSSLTTYGEISLDAVCINTILSQIIFVKAEHQG